MPTAADRLILQPPRMIEYRVDGVSPDQNWLNPWVRCSLDEFLRDNDGLSREAIASDLAIRGRSVLGGGAAPFVTVRAAA